MLKAGSFYISTVDFRMSPPGIIASDISISLTKFPLCPKDAIIFVKSIKRRIRGRYITKLVIDFKEYETECNTDAMKLYFKKII